MKNNQSASFWVLDWELTNHSDVISGKFLFFRNTIVFIFYMFGNSVSVSFLVVFTKLQLMVLTNIQRVVTVEDGITAVVYLLLYLRLKTDLREIIFWIGILYTIPLILESMIYLAFLIKKAPKSKVKPISPLREKAISVQTATVIQPHAMFLEP